MSSIRSKLVLQVIKYWTKWAFRPGYTLQKMRLQMQAQDSRSQSKITYKIKITDQSTPLPGRWLKPKTSSTRRVFLYLHGGAFIMRMPESHTAMVSRLCVAADFSAFLPWYRLAPEHPFPAALEDCFQAYQYLLQEHSPEDIVIAGDSAGGNLTLSLLNLIKQRQCPMPKAAFALSPITDFAQMSATWLLGDDPMLPMQQYIAPQRHYLQGQDLMNPLASPLYGDLSGLPPLLIVAGGIEALRDDAVAYVSKAVQAGVNAQVHIWRGMPHVHTLLVGVPEVAPTEERILSWLNNIYIGNNLADDDIWKSAVTLFNRTPLSGRISAVSNGDQVTQNLLELHSFV